MEFVGSRGGSMWKFQGLIKKEVEFLAVIKNHLALPRVLIFDCKISKGITHF